MLIVIYGEDTYRSREWLRELEKKFREKFDAAGYNVSRFPGNSDIGELAAAVTASPFLGTKRLVVAQRLFAEQGKQDALAALLERIPETSIVILWEDGDEKSFAKIPLFAKSVRKKDTKSYPFPPLAGEALQGWVRARAKELGITFERGALPSFVMRTGSDLWKVSAELEKFAALKKPITEDMVAEFVRGTTEENIFAFVDALASRNSREAITGLFRERAAGGAVPYLISMLVRHFRMLREALAYTNAHARATAPDLAAAFGWHPFVARKVLGQIRAYDHARLASTYDALFMTDHGLKNGTYNADTALDLLVARLLIGKNAIHA